MPDTARQRSGLSPTHEEYHEARARKPVLLFVQMGVTREPDEEKFLQEVSGWEGGHYREPFDSPASLRVAVTGALHRWVLSQQAGPMNDAELTARVTALLPQRSAYAAGSPLLHVAVAGAPTQQVLRPSDLDDPALQTAMEQEALFGERPVFDRGQGVQASVSGTSLVVRQPNAEITVDEQGSVRVSRPARDAGGWPGAGIPSLIEEDVRDRVANAIRYAGWVLDRIDPTHRLSRVALACRLDGGGYLPWRTRAEVAASPDRARMGFPGREAADSPPVALPRAGPSSWTSQGRPRTSPCGCDVRRQDSHLPEPVPRGSNSGGAPLSGGLLVVDDRRCGLPTWSSSWWRSCSVSPWQ